MKKSFFERNVKLTLAIINLIFIGLIFFILNLDIFQDAPNSEKYSVIDRANYQLRCKGKRHIVMRENAPNENSFRIPPYSPKEKYDFKIDENGFVKPSKIHENPDLKIFFIGGSTTECEMVDEKYRFPYFAGRILEEKTGKKIDSYNAGRSGNNSIHSINNLVNKIIPLNPDIVVRMENINDISTLFYEGTYWNRNNTRSNLGCFSKNTGSLRNSRNEWELSPFKNKILDSKHLDSIKNEHRRILELFIAITKAAKAQPVLMTQFNRIETDRNFILNDGSAEFSAAYRQLYIDLHNLTRHVAKENNVLLIDLAKEIEPSEKYIYDKVHLTNEGSKLAAQIISQKLQKIIQ